MKVISDMDLMRYADGDLPASEAAIIAALLPHEPDLRRRLDVFAKTRGPVSAVFDEILEEPVPSHLVACILRAKPAERPRDVRIWTPVDAVRNWIGGLLVPAAMSPAFAASIAVAAVLAGSTGWLAGRSSVAPSALVEAHASGLVASGALADALEQSPSTQAIASNGATVTPVMSFRSTSGAVCREYRIAAAGTLADFAGLGCRTEDGVWRIAMHVETPKAQQANGDYQAAGGGEAIDAFVATIIAGDAFGPVDETALIGKAWQSPDRKPGGLSATP
jgi:hypothetical protein